MKLCIKQATCKLYVQKIVKSISGKDLKDLYTGKRKLPNVEQKAPLVRLARNTTMPLAVNAAHNSDEMLNEISS